jgi:hypothetical protein
VTERSRSGLQNRLNGFDPHPGLNIFQVNLVWYITFVSIKKTIALVMIILGVALIAGFGIYSLVRRSQPNAGLKIDTSPSSLVFVDNVEMGSTPVDKLFPPGEVTIKLIPNSTSSAISTYQTKVRLSEKTYTIIKRDFGSSDISSAGEIISLQPQSDPTPSLSVITSSPDTASVLVDGQPQGFTPLSLSSMSAGTHQITITAPGFASRTISAQTVNSYKLIITVKLSALAPTPIPILTLTPTPTQIATPSTTLIPSPTSKITSTPKVAPTLKISPTPAMPKPYVTILDTPTGFLRVRSSSSVAGTEVGQVKPGENYSLLDTAVSGWYLIKVELDATSSGWISPQYAKLYK